MVKGPCLYFKISKKARDLLYINHKFTLATYTSIGVTELWSQSNYTAVNCSSVVGNNTVPGRAMSTLSLCKTSFSLDKASITSTLICIFTRRPFVEDSKELEQLAPKISNEVVENVLKSLKSWKIANFFFNWASKQNGYRHNCYTYNALASILAHAQQRDPLKLIAKDILKSHCSYSSGALGFLIRCFGSVGLVQEANEFFDQVRLMGLCVPDNYTYNCLLEAISKSSSVDLAEMRFKEMCNVGWGYDRYTLTPLMQVYSNAGRFEEALNVFNKIHESGWADAYVYSMLLLSLTKWGNVDEAYELFERMAMQNIKLNEKTFCNLIHGVVKESRVDIALQLFTKMRESGFTPGASLYDVLIGGLCGRREFEKALSLYSEMKEFGIKPDMRILIQLLSSFSDEREMIRLLEEIPQDKDDKSLVLFYNSVLNSFVSSGLTDKAYDLLQAMMSNSNESKANVDVKMFCMFKRHICPNTTSFNIVIDGLLKNGKLDLALILYKNMPRVGCKPNTLLYNNLICALCVSDRLEESFNLLKEMKAMGLEPTHFTHNSIFGCLCRRNNVPGALNMVKDMRAYGHDPWTKHTSFFVKQLCGNGRAEEACDFLSSMVQEGFLPDIVSYSAAMSGLVNIQKLDQALSLFKYICSRGYCPDVVAYNILISGLCKADRLTEAENMLDEIGKKGLTPSVVTYNLLINGCCKNGLIDKAMLFHERMSGEDREPNVVTYTTLVDGVCKTGRPDEAVRIWNEMEKNGCFPNKIAFMALINGLCKCSRPSTALIYLRKMEDRKMIAETFIYVSMVNAFLSDSDILSAFEIFEEMVDKGKFPDPHDKNCIIARDAMLRFAKDSRTSSGIKTLIDEEKIPRNCLIDN